MSISVVAVGDAIVTSPGLRAKVDPALLDIIADADVRLVNAEFTCPAPTTPPAPLDRHYSIGVGEWAIDGLLDIGMNVASMANNHIADYGWQGVAETLRACRAKGLPVAGVGENLAQARMAAFAETAKGRVGVVAASSSSIHEMLASHGNSGVQARPGTSPLRFSKVFQLEKDDFQFLRHLDERLGSAATRSNRDRLGFVGGFEHKVQDSSFGFAGTTIRLGETSEILTFVDDGDLQALIASVADAKRRSDAVVVSLHCHEGVDDGWNTPVPAAFVESAARQLIDAGARAVFGHGPHMLRGIEVYRGAPIFYSLGNFVFEFEMMDRVPPEMYERYGLASVALPSELHYSIRAKDRDGNWRGFYAEPHFWEGALARCDFDGEGTRVELTMLALGYREERAFLRGMPRVASADHSSVLAERLAELSKPYGTRISYNRETNRVIVEC